MLKVINFQIRYYLIYESFRTIGRASILIKMNLQKSTTMKHFMIRVKLLLSGYKVSFQNTPNKTGEGNS